ncbi:hypothetical protein JCM8547_000194 [Rhodosporidiobolus lusitaniae]
MLLLPYTATLLLLPLALAAPLRLSKRNAVDLCEELRVDGAALDMTSLNRCNFLLSGSNFQPFIERWKTPNEAAEDVVKQLTEKLRFERRKRDLASEVCDTLVNTNTTTNVLSSNEIAGIAVEGDGLLDGLHLFINPSIQSGLFQTATPTTVTLTVSATPTASRRLTFDERKSLLSASASSASAAAASAANKPLIDIEIEGQGVLDGIDVTIAPSLLNSLLRLKPTAT